MDLAGQMESFWTCWSPIGIDFLWSQLHQWTMGPMMQIAILDANWPSQSFSSQFSSNSFLKIIYSFKIYFNFHLFINIWLIWIFSSNHFQIITTNLTDYLGFYVSKPLLRFAFINGRIFLPIFPFSILMPKQILYIDFASSHIK